MAELLVDGDDLVLHLTTLEELSSIHGDLRAPLGRVRDRVPPAVAAALAG
jgi:hypothetical protein